MCKNASSSRSPQIQAELGDVLQRIHAAHCHAGPCQRSSEGACRCFSSSALINMLLIGCWRDSRDDWLLWHSGSLFDFVEPYWNQSGAVQIALFVMTLAEGVVNRWWHRLRINITHIEHLGLHAPTALFFFYQGWTLKAAVNIGITNQDIRRRQRRSWPDGNIHFCAFVSGQHRHLTHTLALSVRIYTHICIYIPLPPLSVSATILMEN